MGRDNEASYFRIGLTVILGVAAILGVLVYIGGLGGNRNEMLVETYYDKPVGGLAVGSAVNFRGVKIGEVRKIGFIGDMYAVNGADEHRIYILMALDMNKTGGDLEDQPERERYLRQMVNDGLRATVAVNAITGLAHVDCDMFSPKDQPVQEIAWKPENVLIPPKESLMETLSVSAAKILHQLNRMDLNAFWSNINASVESISAATLSTRHLVEGYQPELERTLQHLEESASSLKVFAEQIKADPSVLIKGVDVTPLPETAP